MRAAAHMARKFAVAVSLGGLVLLAGCRTAPAPSPARTGPGAAAPWAEQRSALENFTTYGLNGRVAVAASGQGFSASLRYAQTSQRSDLSLDGPLGIGGLRVELEGEALKVSTSRGEQLDGVAARAELERRLGFALPLAELRWWLLGVPAPGAADLDQDVVSGELRGFTQNGWHVSVETRIAGLGFALPKKLTAEREGARLKLLVETWRP